jgi:glutathione synthase/RimK-type ligase-like ATP-grasp enzyme
MLFTHFPAPLLRAEFILADQWRLQGLRPIAANDIPWNHRSFVIDQARRFFDRPSVSKIKHPKYHLAILAKSRGVDAPSNERAIARFVRAAKEHDMSVEILGKEDLGRIAEFDALFIRETTFVNNHTYRFARRAEAEGLVVIDDPESIVRCTNKVFQSELFQRRGVPTPATVILQRENAMEAAKTLGFPCVLKRPDSSFSMGVEKAENDEELARHLQAFFARSELVVAQEFIPSAFDWRIGVLDRKPLFVCKYHMARGHWQIQKAEGAVQRSYGKVEAFPVGEVPKKVVKLGTTAANLIGRGFYGVDVKDVGGRLVVIEVNDNPSVDAGCEDTVLKDDLYMSVMRVFYERLEHRGRNGRP